MALMPALAMSAELPEAQQALPVLKVLYRNTNRLGEVGGGAKEVLRPFDEAVIAGEAKVSALGMQLRDAVRGRDRDRAEHCFASAVARSAQDGYDCVQYTVHDDVDVHRVVLAHRSWETLDVVGEEYARVLLRQSVHYCLAQEEDRIRRERPEPEARSWLPRLLDQHQLESRELGDRNPGDAWVASTMRTLLDSKPDGGADAVAAALGEGIDPEVVGEAIALAANQIVLRDDSPRAHGATMGIHASDAVNAWRHMARVSRRRNAAAALLLAGAMVAKKGELPGEPYPRASHRAEIETDAPEALLREAQRAIEANDQGHTCAAIHRYGELGHPERRVFDLMLRYAISEDGRLHAEKYYRTVSEEFAAASSAFRWSHLVGLARATASAYGYDMKDQPGHRAPGYEDARRLLGV